MSCPSKSDKCFAKAANVAATCKSRGGANTYCTTLATIAYRNCMSDGHDGSASSQNTFTTSQYTDSSGRSVVRRPEGKN